LGPHQVNYSTVKLRFLCEAHYKDESLHEVDMQEGIDLKDQKLWLTKLTPCLVWSLKIAFLAAKVATNLALPGVGSLFPSDQALSSARSFLEGADSRAQQVRSLLESIKNSIEISDSATGRSREELKMLLMTLNPSDRKKKVALTRVALKISRGGYDRVVWICERAGLDLLKAEIYSTELSGLFRSILVLLNLRCFELPVLIVRLAQAPYNFSSSGSHR
jgi:hypothetical protein